MDEERLKMEVLKYREMTGDTKSKWLLNGKEIGVATDMWDEMAKLGIPAEYLTGEPSKPKPRKPNKKMRCIDGTGIVDLIQVGASYEVGEKGEDDMMQVKTDKGMRPLFTDRFEEIA